MIKRILGISLILIPLLSSCVTTTEVSEPEPVVEEVKDDSLHSLVQSRDSQGLEKLFKIDIDVNERDSSGKTALHIAAAEGAGDIVQLLLLQKADPNALDNNGQSPLHLAVAGRHEDAASILVSGGSDIYLKDHSGISPVETGFSSLPMLKAVVRKENVNSGTVTAGTLLHQAATAGNPDAAAWLLSLGANPNTRNSGGLLPVDIALADRSSLNKAKVASLLVESGSLRPQDESFRYFHTLYGQHDINFRFDFGQTALHIASELGHEGVVKLLLEEGAQISNRDKPGNTALHSAVRGGYRNIVALLISAGADVNATDYNSNVPLHMAMTLDRDTEILRLLLGAGANVNAKNSFGNTALHLSVTLNRDRSAAELLLEYGAVLESRNKNGNTPLLEAVDRGNAQIALLLLQKGADIFARNNRGDTPISMSLRRGVTTLSWFMTSENINAQDNEGNSALHMAVLMTASDDVIRFLLENGAEIDSRNFAGDTALHLAVEKENIGLTDQFLTLGGDLYVENNAGETPLSLAFEKGPEFVDRFLIESVVEKTDSLNYTPLFHAVLWEKPEIVRVILDKGAAFNRKSLIGSTPLHEAVKTGNVEIAGILLRAGADVDATDNQGNTPLHEIVYWNSLNLAELLISAGADINKKNLGGRSAFHEAVINGDFEMCSYLIKQGANLEVRDNSGKTPLFDTIIGGDNALMELLISQGSSIQNRDNQGNTPLHAAVIVDNEEAIKYLFNLKADIFASNKNGASPLSLVIASGYDAVDRFLSYENINARDNNGNTPLHIAAAKKASAGILQLMIDKGADKEARNSLGQRPYDKAVEIKYEAGLDILY